MQSGQHQAAGSANLTLSAIRESRLDGIRGLAIILVLVFHLGKALTLTGAAVEPVRQFMDALWVGVDLFFVLSGYLITGILLDSRSSENYFSSFYARRSLRIFPPYYLFLLLAATCALASRQQLPGGLLHYLLYLSNWTRGELPLSGHLWSLSIEEQYYLVWPLVIWLLRAKFIPLACLLLFCATIGARAYALLTQMADAAHLCYYNTFFRLDGLILGAFLAYAARSSTLGAILDRIAGRVCTSTAALLVLVVIREGGFRNQWPLVQLVGYSLCALLFSCLLWLSVRAQSRRIGAFRILDTAFLQSFGKYSYGIYLFHYPFTAYMADHSAARWVSASSTGWVPKLLLWQAAGIAVCYAMGWLSFHLFEKHFLRLKSRFEIRNRTDTANRRLGGTDAEIASK